MQSNHYFPIGDIKKYQNTWTDIEEIEPDKTDIAMLEEIETNPDCSIFVSSEDAMKELGLNIHS